MHSLRVLKVMNLRPYFYLSENRNLSCLVLNWFYNGHSEAVTVLVATLTILKFSESSQLIAMAFKVAQMFLFWSPLFREYKRIIVTQLLHVELLNIFNFLWNLFPADAFCRIVRECKIKCEIQSVLKMRQSDMLLKMHKSFDY